MTRLFRLICLLAVSLVASPLTASANSNAEDVPIDQLCEVEICIYISAGTRDFLYKLKDPATVATFNRLDVFMKRSGLSYDLIFAPWPRALTNAEAFDNILLFQMLRTPAREANYHWLMQASAFDALNLYGRAGLQTGMELQHAISQGMYTAACINQSAQCSYLKSFGFPEDRILKAPFHNAATLETFLYRERVDFIATYHNSFSSSIVDVGGNLDDYRVYFELAKSADYLAAPKTFRADYLKTLQAVSMADQPFSE